MDNHTFTPSRPGGVVCVAERIVAAAIGENAPEPCGYPAGHPIHDVTAVPVDEGAPLTAAQQALRDWLGSLPAIDGPTWRARNRELAALDQLLTLATAGYPSEPDPGDTPGGPGVPAYDINIVRGVVASYVPEGEESYVIAMRALQRVLSAHVEALDLLDRLRAGLETAPLPPGGGRAALLNLLDRAANAALRGVR